jgi:hypothetical protein
MTGVLKDGAGGTRTHDLRFRKPSLYPAELQPPMAASLPWGRPLEPAPSGSPLLCGSANRCWTLRAKDPISAVLVLRLSSFAQLGRHSAQSSLIDPMSPISTKGLLKGAALAFAGAAALGAGSAHAFNCSIGSLGTCSGTLGNYNITSVSATGLGGATGNLVFSLVGSELRANFASGGSNLNPSGSFNINLSAVKGVLTGYKNAGVIQFSGATGTTSFSGTNTTLNNGSFAAPLLGVIAAAPSGSYTFSWANSDPVDAVEGFRTQFTSDVPVPLPVVGAGLAFGFTRKLRKRAKAVA